MAQNMSNACSQRCFCLGKIDGVIGQAICDKSLKAALYIVITPRVVFNHLHE